MAEWVTTPISQLVPRLRQKLNLSTRGEATSSHQSGDLMSAHPSPKQSEVEEVLSDISKSGRQLTDYEYELHRQPQKEKEVEEVLSDMEKWMITLISSLVRDLREELNRAGDLTSAHPSPKQLEVTETLESLKTTWSYAQSAIHDWDGMQIQTEVERRCLANLRQMSFEAEDILDDYEYELHRQLQLEAECHFFEKTVDYIKLHRQLPDEYTSELVLHRVYENDESDEQSEEQSDEQSEEQSDDEQSEEEQSEEEQSDEEQSEEETTRGRAERITDKLDEMCERKEHHFIKKPLDYIRLHRQRTTTLSTIFTDEYILELVLSRLDENVEVRAPTTTPLTSEAFLDQTKNRATKITEKLDEIRKSQVPFRTSENRRPSVAIRPPSGDIPTVRYICSRDADKTKVVKMIVERNKQGEDPVSVIALVGAGGVGKTTLAQMVYKQVKDGFDATAWVYVSDVFDVEKITRGIIESVTRKKRKKCDLTEFSALQEELHDILQGKSLLLVLDDVWNEDYALWETLCFIHHIGLLQGSKILVTTRSERDAVIMQPREEYHYHLKPLTSEQSWQLFQEVVFVQQEPADKQMELIAEKIAYKCRGSPLVLTAIGSLLRSDYRPDRWEKIMESELWNVKDESGAMKTLELSYIYLPAHLKQCFLYCSVYPKDYEFGKNELVWLWMAQNLVRGNEGERPEDRGLECLDGLLQRSLILRKESEDHGETFVLHDLMHDLAQYILKREHTLLSNSDASISNRSHGLYESRVGGTWIINNENGEHDISNLPVERIRVLDLSCYTYKMDQYLALIGNMKRLRYLQIRDPFSRLPDSVRKLYYLNTVVVDKLGMLPDGIRTLQNLRHLSLDDFFEAQPFEIDLGTIEFPVGFGRLTNLQHLTNFEVRRVGGHCTIAELKGLRSLKGEVWICGLENVLTGEEAKAAELDKLVGIKKLVLCFDYMLYSGRHFEVQQKQVQKKEVLENLRPHANLAELVISEFDSPTFPRWLGDPSFTNLVNVTLSYGNCKELPGLGQLPCLKILTVYNLTRVQHVHIEFFGCCPSSEAFPMLEKLWFHGLQNWEEWYIPEECKFPRLEYLRISYCTRLKLPLVIEKPPAALSELDVIGSSIIETWCREHATTSLAGIEQICGIFAKA